MLISLAMALTVIISVSNAWTTYKEEIYDPGLYLIPRPPLLPKGAWSFILRPSDIKSSRSYDNESKDSNAQLPQEPFSTGYKAASYQARPSFIKNYDVMRLVGGIVYDSHFGGNNKHGGYGAESFGVIGNGRNVYKSGSNTGWRSGWGNGKWGHYGSG